MVNPIVGQQAEASQQPATELRITIWRDEFVDFKGTAAQLVAEGLIPEGLEWPRAAALLKWEAGHFSYLLHRSRPEGHKGHSSSWWHVDYWSLRVRVKGRDFFWCQRRELERMAEDLVAARYRASEAGQREWTLNYRRHLVTQNDAAFQAFKSLVPGLVPPKRGRKPKAA